ncbi:MAG: hypothetical protein JWR21_331 [Herminiimonas sp.]|nr:hypothetical protein [Herminiimonas sp.]
MRYLLTPLAFVLLAGPAFGGLPPSHPVTSLGSSGGNTMNENTNNFGHILALRETGGTSAAPSSLHGRGETSAPGRTEGRSFNSAFWRDGAGQVAAYGGRPGSHACLYADSLALDFEALGGNSNAAYGISDGGQVAGHKTRSGKSASDADSYGNGSMGGPGASRDTDNFGTGAILANGANSGNGGNINSGTNNGEQAGASNDLGSSPGSHASPFANGSGGGIGASGGNYGGGGGGGGGTNGGQTGGNGGNGGGPGNAPPHDLLTDGGVLKDFNALLHPTSGFTPEGTTGTDGNGQLAAVDCTGQCDTALPSRSEPTAVPEPGSLALFTLALAALAASGWIRRKRVVPATSRGPQPAR